MNKLLILLSTTIALTMFACGSGQKETTQKTQTTTTAAEATATTQNSAASSTSTPWSSLPDEDRIYFEEVVLCPTATEIVNSGIVEWPLMESSLEEPNPAEAGDGRWVEGRQSPEDYAEAYLFIRYSLDDSGNRVNEVALFSQGGMNFLLVNYQIAHAMYMGTIDLEDAELDPISVFNLAEGDFFCLAND